MTTPIAERLYLAQHLQSMEGKSYVVYNPQNRPLEELPIIIGFNNGGSPSWYYAVAIAQDGTVLGQHLCSHECYMLADLGVLEGTRPDRHKNDYQPHYPNGYRMAFVSHDDVKDFELLQEALRLNKRLAEWWVENCESSAAQQMQ